MKHNIIFFQNRALSQITLFFIVLIAASISYTIYSIAPVDGDSNPGTAVDAVFTAFREQSIASSSASPPKPDFCVLENIVQPGDTASTLLEGYLPYSQVLALSDACQDVFALTRIQAGKPYAIITKEGLFTGFEYEINKEEKLVVEKTTDGFDIQCEPIAFDVVVERVEGTILHSLFGALSSSGEGPELAIVLAEIFGWEIDFFRDIREGDSFTVIVEKRYRNGNLYGYGRILAAEFQNNGAEFQGFRLEDEQGLVGYFDAEGRNLKKAFLAAPLSFTRISSNFNLNRLHPILKVRRPHPAIDYAAPSGTPVKAIGDGTVVNVYWDNGGGNVVHIRHCNGYETKYLHLSGFAEGLEPGDRVIQGQIIGYVGSTGLSTGPHLDFRISQNGQYINFATIENPRAESVPEEMSEDFSSIVQELDTILSSTEVVISPLHKTGSL